MSSGMAIGSKLKPHIPVISVLYQDIPIASYHNATVRLCLYTVATWVVVRTDVVVPISGNPLRSSAGDKGMIRTYIPIHNLWIAIMQINKVCQDISMIRNDYFFSLVPRPKCM